MPPNKPLIRCSAPGKVILHGEHSVVYGKLAIAASLDLRTTVTLEERANSKFEINFIDLKFKRHFSLADISSIKIPAKGAYLNPDLIDHNQLLEQIKGLNIPEDLSPDKYSSLISLLYLYYGIVSTAQLPQNNALYLTVKTDLTLGSGTGSSASLMVALSSAFIQYIITKKPELKPEFEINPDNYECFNEFQLKLISRWGFQAERIIHGNPSGIDNTVCTYGSLVSFRKGRAPFPVKCGREIRGVIVDTNVPKNTAIQVEKVANLLKKRPKIVENILEALENVSDEALDCLIQLGDVKELEGLEGLYRDLLGLAQINHHLLQSLGVSHPSLDRTVEIMSKFGLKGKLTGAGGGGYAIALIPPFVCLQDVQDLCAQLETEGFKGLLIKLGSSGVRFEK